MSRHAQPSRGARTAPVRRWSLAAVLVVALGASIVVASALPSLVVAQSDEEAAQRAAREIQQARDRANAAADAYFQAQSELDQLADELVALEIDNQRLQGLVDRLRRNVESLAVARFVSSGASGIPLLTGIQAPQDQLQAEVFTDVFTNTSNEALDEFDAARTELEANEAELEQSRTEIENQQLAFAELQQQAQDEVVRLRAIEEDRLQDEAVQQALDAQVAAERARLEDQIRREAEAAARAIPDPGAGLPPPTTTALGADATGSTVEDPSVVVNPAVDGEADATANGDAGAAETTAPPVGVGNSGASGGTSGGRTGTGGTGSNPRPLDTGSGYLDAMICPMPGSAFGDTWGAPRSGGRRHEGVDMIAPRGIPIYAVVSGTATFKQNRLGGNAVSLVGDNGNRYYYGHLDRYEGSSRRVSQGDVIGYNGDTGNALYSTPHLHFEIRPGGGLPVNPYPSVRAAGC